MMGKIEVARTVGAALVALAGMTENALASRSIRIDDISTGAFYQSFAACTLGKACDTPLTSPFSFTLPDGTETNQLYVYKEGVVGLGSRVYGDANHVIDYTNPAGAKHYFIAAGLARRHDLTDVAYFDMSTPTAFGINWYTGKSPNGGVFELLFTYDPSALYLPNPDKISVAVLAGGDNYSLIGPPGFDGNPTDSTDPAHGPRAGDGLPAGAFIGSNLSGFDPNANYLLDPGSGTGNAPDPGPETLPTPEPATAGIMLAGLAAAGSIARRRARARRAA